MKIMNNIPNELVLLRHDSLSSVLASDWANKKPRMVSPGWAEGVVVYFPLVFFASAVALASCSAHSLSCSLEAA